MGQQEERQEAGDVRAANGKNRVPEGGSWPATVRVVSLIGRRLRLRRRLGALGGLILILVQGRRLPRAAGAGQKATRSQRSG